MKNSILLFFILAILSILIFLLVQEIVFTEDVYYASLSEQMSAERIEKLFEKREESRWVVYAMKIIFHSIKIFMVAICLLTGLFIIDKKCSFTALINVIIKSEFIFILPSVITLLWFGVFEQSSYGFSDVKNFAPLSLLNFFDATEIELWLNYSLSAVNMFELFYMCALAYGLSKICELEIFQALKITLFSYGIGLLLWTVFVTFLIISFTA